MKHKANDPEQTSRFVHKKSLGQNFLTSAIVPNLMAEAALVESGDVVFEIGPGTGMLTKELLGRRATVYAVEADVRAYEILQDTFKEEIAAEQLFLAHGDAREITPKKLGLKPYSFKVVANIPYYLSGFLLRTILESDTQPSSLVFLLQKELVERIARDPKESILSLSVKVFGVPKYYKTVKRGHFNPPPKVDSAILQISAIGHNYIKPEFLGEFFNLLHLGLGQRRKQLMTTLKTTYDKELLAKAFTDNQIKLTARGEDLDITTWVKLLYTLNPQTNPH